MSDAPARTSRSLSRLAGPLALALVAAFMLQTLAVDASRPLRIVADATPVATVDVSRVLEQIDERSEWDIRIETLKASIQQEAATRRAAMERRLAESEEAATPDDRQRIRDEVALMQLRLEAWGTVKEAEIDREESLKWRSIYRNLRREAQRVAEAEGYAMVLVDDSVGEIRTATQSQMPLQQQVLEQITNRRILFATNGIDVTDQVIVRMNNAANTNP